jgi:hypothetical protein
MMTTAQGYFMTITLDVIVAGLVICAFILLGVYTYRAIVRTRKRPR